MSDKSEAKEVKPVDPSTKPAKPPATHSKRVKAALTYSGDMADTAELPIHDNVTITLGKNHVYFHADNGKVFAVRGHEIPVDEFLAGKVKAI